MFGQAIRTPWEELRSGLVLGGDALWRKVREMVSKSEGAEEVRWQERVQAEDISRVIASLAAEERDRRVAIWLRVRLGGERMTTVAADYGYRGGSGVYRVVERLEAEAKKDRALTQHLNSLRAAVSSVKS